MRHMYLAVFLTVLLVLPGVTSAQMIWNKTAYFDGSSYIAIPPSPELNLTGSFTIESLLFITDSSLYSGHYVIVEKRNGSADEGFCLYLNLGRVAIRTNSTTHLVGNHLLSLNTWHHVSGSYNATSGTFYIYVNATVDTFVTVGGVAPKSSADSVTIGGGFNKNFKGYLENVRIWNVVRGGSNINAYRRSQLSTGGGVYEGLVLSLPFQLHYKSANPFTVTDRSIYSHGGVNHGVVGVDYGYGPYLISSMNPCVHLDGVEDYLAGGDGSAISPTSAITMEAWVYPETTKTQVIVSKGTTYRLLLYNPTNDLLGLINGHSASVPVTIPRDRWTHVAFTYTAAGESYSYYVNGEPAGTGTLTGAGPIADSGDSLYVGGGPVFVDFLGYLDEVRISNYAKTEAQIRSYLYRSIDQSNEPNSGATNVVYNFDGTTRDNANDSGPMLLFRGNARFTYPIVRSEPESPMVRAEELNFPGGFYLRTLNRSIPDGGIMKADSFYVSEDVILTDINVFVAINHPDERELTVRVILPGGPGKTLYQGQQLAWYAGNVITIFDDQADSTLYGRASFTPRVRPLSALTPPPTSRSKGWWKITVEDNAADGETGRLYAWGLQINNQTVVGVSPETPVPLAYELTQNYPNPFNPATVVGYTVPAAGDVHLVVYDLLGREVRTLVNERKSPGSYQVTFDATGLASGVYLYRLTAGSFVQTRKMVLVR